jgi:hypothetical protein
VILHINENGARLHDPSALVQAGVEIERVGYSALAAGGWIRPHWGETNARLKLHLGLAVDPLGCARFTIGRAR